MPSHRFKSKGLYIAFGIAGKCIGGFNTLAEAKRACGRDELTPMGGWEHESAKWQGSDNFHEAYYARSGCKILVGLDHPHNKLTKEEID